MKTFKRDYVSVNPTPDAKTVMAQLPLWFDHYNDLHPHKALGYQSPASSSARNLKPEHIRSFGGNSTCFSARYSSQTRKTTIHDIQQAELLKNGQPNTFGEIDLKIDEAFFKNSFRVGAAATKTFVLLLSNNLPKSLLWGKKLIWIECCKATIVLNFITPTPEHFCVKMGTTSDL